MSDASRPEGRAIPEPVRLGVRPGVAPSAAPPVRIYLGSEPGQFRAERVFVWSVQRHRDPSRVYEIHLMKSLSGFQRRHWTTGFTNYRFAVPDFAERSGRAIYNDVDQVYLADPAELFDLDMDDHGFLALAPNDPSVMLLDCARMAQVWNLPDACSLDKDALQRRAARSDGLFGPLPSAWHARDAEFCQGTTHCLHFSNLHTQPWRPFPERFVYQRHPHEDVWLELEHEADEARFEIFSAEHPSELFRSLDAPPPLDRVPIDDLAWVLDARFDSIEASSGETVEFDIRCDPPGGVVRGPDGRHEIVRSAAWWSDRLDDAAARHPGVRWEARLEQPGRKKTGRVCMRVGGPAPDGSAPRVWILQDDRPGNASQSRGLADALGWPTDLKRLVLSPASMLHNRLLGASIAGIDPAKSDALEPPWPDLVIAAGRRTAPVALWIRDQSGGRTRLVQLGRKGGDRADLFDLAVTPRYGRLFPQRHRIEIAAPLHRMTPERIEDARREWRDRLEPYPSPRITALLGGKSGQYAMDPDTARRLGEALARVAKELGGSVLATTSRRTGDRASSAVRDALSETPGEVYGPDDPGENPFLGYLAWADQLVITADSESMLAEATSLGMPVYIYPLPQRLSFRLLRFFRELVRNRATAEPLGPRGTGRPQRGLERLCGRLIEHGFVRPSRDLELLHQDLIRRGVALRFGAAGVVPSGPPLRELDDVADRVRSMMGLR